MEEKWFIRMKKADFDAISRRFGISRILARLLRNRDLTTAEEIDRYLHAERIPLSDGMLLKDMEVAVKLLSGKIRSGEKIRIVGDYDIDGVMASAVLQKGFFALGAPDVDCDIPDRVRDGYGLNRRLIEQALLDGVDTIVTCDNGIAAREEIAFAKEHGMTVIVTDHHAVPFTLTEPDGEKRYLLPAADAVVDHQRADCPYPYKKLCGAAVAFLLVDCLHRSMGVPFSEKDELTWMAAFATVGDVMELDGENRGLVLRGLKLMNRTEHPGLRALIRVNNLADTRIRAYHIGFILGPCLNASGRLDTAKRALRLILTDDAAEADRLAGDLKALNDSRKDLTGENVKRAVQIVERDGLLQRPVLIVYLPECHESIAGIVAGRIREKYARPTFILTRGESAVKGSGRSTENYNMIEEMMKCGDVFLHFGGHRMAAGLSIEERRIAEFSRRLNDACPLAPEDFYEKVTIDMCLPFSEITERLVAELELLEPFGMGNEKPLFAVRDARASDLRILGRRRNVLRMRLYDASGTGIDAVRFGEEDELLQLQRQIQMAGMRLTAAFYPSVNVFRGEKKMEIVIRRTLPAP